MLNCPAGWGAGGIMTKAGDRFFYLHTNTFLPLLCNLELRTVERLCDSTEKKNIY